MKRSNNFQKHVLFIIIFISLFIIFIYIYYKPTDYQLRYKINNIDVSEEYNRKKELYYFTLNYDDIEFKLLSLDKYTNKRKLIKNIEIIHDGDSTCLDFQTQGIKLYSICNNNKEYFSELKNVNFSKNTSFENINIGHLDSKKYLLWNYNEFILLNTKNKKLELFDKDIYNINLFYIYKNYFLIPDYDQNYKFDKFYLINVNNGKIEKIDLRFEIYFDSYFLGNDQDKIYIFDKKEEQLYYIDLPKKEIYKAQNKILIDGIWKDVSIQTLKNDQPKFSEEKYYEYVLNNGNLYLEYNNFKFKVTNLVVSQIVASKELEVYFIANDILYKYDPYNNLQALMQYSEWNFNNQNMIFIFD